MVGKRKLAMTSVTFRNLSVDEIITLAKNCKLDGIEWGGDVHVKPDNVEYAQVVGKKTRAAGLEVISYGSYYALGKYSNPENEFLKIIKIVKALGTNTVRIWSLNKASKDCGVSEFRRAINELKVICALAKKYDVTVAMEYHSNSLNDSATASKRLISEVGADNLKTYWQPLFSEQENLKDINSLLDNILNVHVYNWSFGEIIQRNLLYDAKEEWEKYIKLIKSGSFILEFTKDDDTDNFIADAKTLADIMAE